MSLNVLQEIERLKNEKPTWERHMRWDGMKAVFGGPPSLLWCNPFTGLRLRRLMLLTQGRRIGSEFSVWKQGRLMQRIHTLPSLKKDRLYALLWQGYDGQVLSGVVCHVWLTGCSSTTPLLQQPPLKVCIVTFTCWCRHQVCTSMLNLSRF